MKLFLDGWFAAYPLIVASWYAVVFTLSGQPTASPPHREWPQNPFLLLQYAGGLAAGATVILCCWAVERTVGGARKWFCHVLCLLMPPVGPTLCYFCRLRFTIVDGAHWQGAPFQTSLRHIIFTIAIFALLLGFSKCPHLQGASMLAAPLAFSFLGTVHGIERGGSEFEVVVQGVSAGAAIGGVFCLFSTLAARNISNEVGRSAAVASAALCFGIAHGAFSGSLAGVFVTGLHRRWARRRNETT